MTHSFHKLLAIQYWANNLDGPDESVQAGFHKIRLDRNCPPKQHRLVLLVGILRLLGIFKDVFGSLVNVASIHDVDDFRAVRHTVGEFAARA
jgi:hypothetical protein